MRMTSTGPRRGVVLFAALALMSVIALLVAGATASTRASQRASRLAHTDASLTTAADYALTNVLGDAQELGLADLPLGTPTVLDVPIPGAPDVHASVAVTRLPAGVLLDGCRCSRRHRSWTSPSQSRGGVSVGRRARCRSGDRARGRRDRQ